MKTAKYAGFLLWGILVLSLATGAIYARTPTQVTAPSVMDQVDIAVMGLEQVEGEVRAWQEQWTVLPGSRFSRIPRIVNRGCACHIRARVQWLTEAGEITDALSTVRWIGMGSDWLLAADGYYYYEKVLLQGETVDLFQAVQFPVDLPQQEWEGKTIRMVVSVDAIQSDHIIPDYGQEFPWDVPTQKVPDQQSVETGKESLDSPATGDAFVPQGYLWVMGVCLLVVIGSVVSRLKTGGKTDGKTEK